MKIFPDAPFKALPLRQKKEVFWTSEYLESFINDLMDYGIDRWDKFSIKREEKEISTSDFWARAQLRNARGT